MTFSPNKHQVIGNQNHLNQLQRIRIQSKKLVQGQRRSIIQKSMDLIMKESTITNHDISKGINNHPNVQSMLMKRDRSQISHFNEGYYNNSNSVNQMLPQSSTTEETLKMRLMNGYSSYQLRNLAANHNNSFVNTKDQYKMQHQVMKSRGSKTKRFSKSKDELSALISNKNPGTRYNNEIYQIQSIEKIENQVGKLQELVNRTMQMSQERISQMNNQMPISKKVLHRLKNSDRKQGLVKPKDLSSIIYQDYLQNQNFLLDSSINQKIETTYSKSRDTSPGPHQYLNPLRQQSVQKIRTQSQSKQYQPNYSQINNQKQDNGNQEINAKKLSLSPEQQTLVKSQIDINKNNYFHTDHKRHSNKVQFENLNKIEQSRRDHTHQQQDESQANISQFLENSSNNHQASSEMIQDVRLRRFYDHLDSINKQSLSPFQHFQRYKLLQQGEISKTHVVNTVDYKIRNSVHSQYQTTDYFPKWIIDEMQKIEKNSNYSNVNIYKLCQKLHKDRTVNDRRAICNYLKNKVNFFKDIEKEKLQTLTQKIATLEYDPDQMMIRQGDDGDFLLIIYEGKAQIKVDGNRVAEAGPHTLIGEAALEYKQKRKASVIAITRCKCLAIYKADYDSAVSLFKSQQKQLNQNILRRLYVIGGWNIIKIKGFSRILNEIQFNKGQIIYDLGQTSEVLYIIKSGRIALEVFYEIERTNSIPIGQKQWEIQRTFQIIRRTILTLGPNSMFGLEEIIQDVPKRVIRARVLENSECLYANKTAFMEYFNLEDKEKMRSQIAYYTDFESEAKLLLSEIQNKRIQSKLFLNAANTNVGGINTEKSRSISQTQYTNSQSASKRRNSMIRKFLNRIVQNNQVESPIEQLKLKNLKRQQQIQEFFTQNEVEHLNQTDNNNYNNNNGLFNQSQMNESIYGVESNHNVMQSINRNSEVPAALTGNNNNINHGTINNSTNCGGGIKYDHENSRKNFIQDVQNVRKSWKTIKINKQSITVKSNSILDNLKTNSTSGGGGQGGSSQSPNKSKNATSTDVRGPGHSNVGMGSAFKDVQITVENGIKIRLITEKIT